MPYLDVKQLEDYVGKELGVSDWFIVSQERINQFSQVTEGHQWIHTDIHRAKIESPYGTTIAHGFLTLSLLSKFNSEIRNFAPEVTVINYGLDKVRFPKAVKTNSRIRNRAVLLSIESKGEKRLLLKTRNIVEIEHEDIPAMVADSISMILY